MRKTKCERLTKRQWQPPWWDIETVKAWTEICVPQRNIGRKEGFDQTRPNTQSCNGHKNRAAQIDLDRRQKLTISIEQHHLFLLYQNVVVRVIDYEPGLPAMTRTNLLRLDRVQNREYCESYWEPPWTHPLRLCGLC